MSTAAIAWMSPLAPLPQLSVSDDPAENSKQVLKALKCVAFSSKQVGDMLRRLQAVNDETELLRAHIVENVLSRRQRAEQLADLRDDLEQAQTLGHAELLKDLADELKLLRREDQRERVLLSNLKRTLRSRVRAHKALQQQKGAADEATLVFNCKHNLIQSMVATCAKTTFLSASELGYEDEGYEDGGYEDDEDEDADAQCSSAGESDYDLSDFVDNDDVEMAQQDGDYPKLRVAQPDEFEDDKDEDEVGELSSVSAWSFESDSQASCSVKDSRRRSVSFGPLPLSHLAEENVEMESSSPLTLEELSDGEEDRRSNE
ncbi:hypothetical protein PF010_g12938 [Phytophthora fragariae]|nr:hypothetical protein PF003_g38971 [Phytophthora fragariae]KAE9066415.1 hypothetical protein PF007_g28483 [Phytophthora fragariae]KAE9105637.1 hypothetical protein PF010_g12938 [Phytophthora fragariae]